EWLRSEGLLKGDPKRKKPKLGRIVAVYNYVDENNAPLFEVVRFEPKDFRQRRPDGNGDWIWNLSGVRRVPYHLPELLKAAIAFFCGCEKDANNVRKLGLTATTGPGGASKWRTEFNRYFAGKTVYILPDNDAAGRAHAKMVAANLYPVAKEIRIVELPNLAEKGDISDWIAQGG